MTEGTFDRSFINEQSEAQRNGGIDHGHTVLVQLQQKPVS